MVTAPSTIHAGCTRRIELTDHTIPAPVGRIRLGKEIGAEPDRPARAAEVRLDPERTGRDYLAAAAAA